MISAYPRRCRCGSWACRYCSRNLGSILLSRLKVRRDRVPAGYTQIMVTLTYALGRFLTPAAAVQDAIRNHRVSRAVGAFAAHYRINVHGGWLCKLELQKRSWPHFHVLLDIPTWLVPRLPMPRRGCQTGAFDAFWRFGYSNVQLRPRLDYQCKLVAYVCKDASASGESGVSVLEGSGLPAHGFKWVTTSRDYWRAWEQPGDDDLSTELTESWPVEGETVEAEEGRECGSHADRVRGCGCWSELLVDGVSEHVDHVSLWVPFSRGILSASLWEYACQVGLDCECYESGVVRRVSFRSVSQVREFMELLLPPGEALDAILEALGWQGRWACHATSGSAVGA